MTRKTHATAIETAATALVDESPARPDADAALAAIGALNAKVQQAHNAYTAEQPA